MTPPTATRVARVRHIPRRVHNRIIVLAGIEKRNFTVQLDIVASHGLVALGRPPLPGYEQAPAPGVYQAVIDADTDDAVNWVNGRLIIFRARVSDELWSRITDIADWTGQRSVARVMTDVCDAGFVAAGYPPLPPDLRRRTHKHIAGHNNSAGGPGETMAGCAPTSPTSSDSAP